MKDKQTPLMKQYNDIKKKYPETVLLFRLGDFFETFEDDAVITAKICGITLTKRNNGAAGDMPLAGFPHHQLDVYLPKLVRAGYRVAVCEQLEDPKKAKGIVKRGVVEVVTPGVALYDKLLDNKKNNYLAAIAVKEYKNETFLAGVSVIDISTGEFFAFEIHSSKLPEVLESFAPSEVIINKQQKDKLENIVKSLSSQPSLTKLEDWLFEYDFAREQLLNHFKTKSLRGFGLEDFDTAIKAAGAAIYYISETQNSALPHIKSLSNYEFEEFMSLDHSTRRNLEITYSYSGSLNDGTLISILDKTVTSMGARLFKKWITKPLKNTEQINARLEAVKHFYNEEDLRASLRKSLKHFCDLERSISKIATNRANPREVAALRHSLKLIPEIKAALEAIDVNSINKLNQQLNPLPALIEILDNALIDEPSINFGNGSIFRAGISKELDEYVEAKYSAKNWLALYQEKQKSETGINSLKVSFNSVFGYYIEVTRLHSSKVPDSYQRKQTLTNAERYITPELKEFESKILNAEEQINIIETNLFQELREKISEFSGSIQQNAQLISMLDCILSFAETSKEYDYNEPEVDDSTVLEIEEGRHPVVERMLPIGEAFAPNSTFLSTDENQIHIITGPNMAGKSCYLRQVALIVLLAQIGCFVPAKRARIGIVDRIFTRVGAQDNLSAGESTFLVEMQEAANIMNNATERSLILLDEVGRGTATFDGISIAWSIAEFLHNKIRAKTLFATHYHELNGLADRYDRIENYKVEVLETGNNIIFTHNVKKGASDHSFGIHVAKMAGLPYDVINRADEIMKILENASTKKNGKSAAAKPDISAIDTKKDNKDTDQLAIFEIKDDELRERLMGININNLTPVQALQILADMKKKVLKPEKN